MNAVHRCHKKCFLIVLLLDLGTGLFGKGCTGDDIIKKSRHLINLEFK
jgi:hypothetical protein